MGYLYCISHNDEFFKFGITTRNPYIRMANMQTGNPVKLTMNWCFKTNKYKGFEKLIHCSYSDKCTVGEWFKISSDEAEKIYDKLKSDTLRSYLIGNGYSDAYKKEVENEYYALNL